MFAIAEFGSSSRNTSDEVSDRDLLVVCTAEERNHLYAKYTSLGFSVSLYSPEQLHFMQERGSLFIQHLKHESVILKDQNGELGSFLESSPLIPPTDTELAISESTMRFVKQWNEIECLGAWQADFLYCVSRDYLIKKLAKFGFIAFGIEELEMKCSELNLLDKIDFESLRKLRKIKAAYRSGQPVDIKDAGLKSRNWLKALERTLQTSAANFPFFNLSTIDKHLLAKSYSSNYERIRSLEAMLQILNQFGLEHPNQQKLTELTTNLNLYGSSQIRGKSLVSRHLVETCTLWSQVKQQIVEGHAKQRRLKDSSSMRETLHA